MGEKSGSIYIALCRKMEKEYEQFLKRLEASRPEDIIEASYEKVFKEDILYMFSEDIIGTENGIIQLLSMDRPLDFCFESWRRSGASYMQMLRECIEDKMKEKTA